MIGAIAGDIVGSVYEHDPIKTKHFPLFDAGSTFTDDTVLTVAIASAIDSGRTYLESVLAFGRAYPQAGYGRAFKRWLRSSTNEPYNSWGNGAAMRVSPIGWAFSTRDDVLHQARLSAQITHDHPEGIKGAQATALAVFLARTQHDKSRMKAEIEQRFGYDLDSTLDAIRPWYAFDSSCQATVPQAIIAFLESDSCEDAIRNAVSLGGDSDTLACIAGSIAEAFYGPLPAHMVQAVQNILTPDLWNATEAFRAKHVLEH